jgi:hypothetical protein
MTLSRSEAGQGRGLGTRITRSCSDGHGRDSDSDSFVRFTVYDTRIRVLVNGSPGSSDFSKGICLGLWIWCHYYVVVTEKATIITLRPCLLRQALRVASGSMHSEVMVNDGKQLAPYGFDVTGVN